MAQRDKLAERAQPYLEPGEQVKHVFTGQTGPNPFRAALRWLIILIADKYFIFVVTDRAILVLDASKWVPSKPKGIEARLRRRPSSLRPGADRPDGRCRRRSCSRTLRPWTDRGPPGPPR